MVPVEQEQNIEVLRQYTLWLQSQVKELAGEVSLLKNAKELSKQEFLDNKLRRIRSEIFDLTVPN